jgi:hypothetical protein
MYTYTSRQKKHGAPGLRPPHNNLFITLQDWSNRTLQKRNEVPADILCHVIRTVHSFVKRNMFFQVPEGDDTVMGFHFDLISAKGDSFNTMRNFLRHTISALTIVDE